MIPALVTSRVTGSSAIGPGRSMGRQESSLGAHRSIVIGLRYRRAIVRQALRVARVERSGGPGGALPAVSRSACRTRAARTRSGSRVTVLATQSM